jgi:hypothetical protein
MFRAAELIAGFLCIKPSKVVLVLCLSDWRVKEAWDEIYKALPQGAAIGAYGDYNKVAGLRIHLKNGSILACHETSYAHWIKGMSPDLVYLDTLDIQEEHMDHIGPLTTSFKGKKVITMVGSED